jgi:hypothetical protein
MREWNKPASTFFLGSGLWLLCLFVYLSKIPLNYTYDGMVFASRVENDHARLWDLFHPHHLLYTFLGRMVFLWGKAHGATWDGLATLQFMDIAIGLSGVLIAFHLLVRETGNRLVAALTALGLAFSFSYWYFSTSPGVRIFASVTPLFAWYVLTYLKDHKPWFGLVVGSAHALAVLGHQTNLYLGPAFLAGIWCISNKSLMERLKASLYYLFALGFWVLAVYGFVGRFACNRTTYAQWISWILSYSRIPGWPRGNFGPGGFAMAKFGTMKAFLVGASPFRAMSDPFTLQNAQTIFQYGLLVLLIFLVIRLDIFWKYHRQALCFFLLWLLPFVPFFIWWDPDNIEFWVTTTPPCWILMGTVVAELSDRWENPVLSMANRGVVLTLWGWLIALLFLCNFSDLLLQRPVSSTHDRRPMMSALDWKVHVDDLLVLDGINTLPFYLDRFQKREYLALYPFFRRYQMAALKDKEDKSKHIKTFVSAETSPTPTPDPWKDLADRFEEKWKHHRQVWVMAEAEDENDAWREKLEKMLNLPEGRMSDFFHQYGQEPVTYRGKVYYCQLLEPTPTVVPMAEATPTPVPVEKTKNSKEKRKKHS